MDTRKKSRGLAALRSCLALAQGDPVEFDCHEVAAATVFLNDLRIDMRAWQQRREAARTSASLIICDALAAGSSRFQLARAMLLQCKRAMQGEVATELALSLCDARTLRRCTKHSKVCGLLVARIMALPCVRLEMSSRKAGRQKIGECGRAVVVGVWASRGCFRRRRGG